MLPAGTGDGAHGGGVGGVGASLLRGTALSDGGGRLISGPAAFAITSPNLSGNPRGVGHSSDISLHERWIAT